MEKILKEVYTRELRGEAEKLITSKSGRALCGESNVRKIGRCNIT
jgi:hypothetical protein